MKFLESYYYKSVKFKDKFVHENFPSLAIDNKGTLLIFLYILLVVPRQLLEQNFREEFDRLNNTIERLQHRSRSNYITDREKIDYVRHLRNAVAHARVDFSNNGFVTFRDENRRGLVCEIPIPLSDVGQILTELQSVFMKYVEQVKSGFRA